MKYEGIETHRFVKLDFDSTFEVVIVYSVTQVALETANRRNQIPNRAKFGVHAPRFDLSMHAGDTSLQLSRLLGTFYIDHNFVLDRSLLCNRASFTLKEVIVVASRGIFCNRPQNEGYRRRRYVINLTLIAVSATFFPVIFVV